jgi:hypothetical protein
MGIITDGKTNGDFYDQMTPRWAAQATTRKIDISDDEQLWKSVPKGFQEDILGEYPDEKPKKEPTYYRLNDAGEVEQVENPVFKTWNDAVSPKHYKDIVPGYEYMDIMEHVLGFEGTVEHLRGQIFKYLMRFGKKDDRRLESGKVAWYAKRLEDVIDRNMKGDFPCRPKQTRPYRFETPGDHAVPEGMSVVLDDLRKGNR